jgi:two-component system, cell cycle sensor histidine kinase and response regulator CckA
MDNFGRERPKKAVTVMSRPADSATFRRLKQALSESEVRREALLDSSLDCIICVGSDCRITEFNLAAERALRVPRKKALGRDLIELIFPAGLRDRCRRELFPGKNSAGMELISKRIETTALRADGKEFPVELTITDLDIGRQPSFIVYLRDITARKQAEETVVWLASVVENSRDAIISKNLEGRILSWNKGAELTYGYSSEEMVGEHISILAPPGRHDEIDAIIEKLKTGCRIDRLETVRIAKGGRRLDVSLTISPVFNPDGTVAGASIIARDITAEKAVQEALRRANETSIYRSPIPIVAVDTRRLITTWNPAAEEVFGWSEKEVLGKSNPIIPEHEATNAAQLHRRLLAGETIIGEEVLRQKRDGTSVIISLVAAPLWDENHNIRGIVGFLTDITERKCAEQALRTAEEKYRGIFENTFEGIYQTTPEGKYLSANPALARMLGFESPAELIQLHTDIRRQEYADPSMREEFIQLMEKNGTVRNFEYQVHRKDGKIIWFSENAHAVRRADGTISHFEGTVRDISGQRELEQQLRQMQKIEAIGRLAGGIAHDFNNILMAASSYAELLDKKVADSSTRRYVGEILAAINRGASLTQGLLAFSRKQVVSPKVLDVNSLISHQLAMLQRLIPENVELKFLPGAIGNIKADSTQIEQTLLNLVINARDAMPRGGIAIIETLNATLDPEDSGISREPQVRDYVMLSVSDNGCGMDAETQSHLFEPFFTTKEQGKGTGLGLATVFGIVKQNGGQICVRSQAGLGSTFKLYFPRVKEAAESYHSGTSDIVWSGTETILLVEDEEAVRESTAEYLTGNGYSVLTARHGAEALALVREHNRPIHLLLTDLIMPNMSGRELSEKLIRIHPETRVIFISGYSNNLLSSDQVLKPNHVLIQKPFRLAVLGQRVRETLDRASAAASGN